MKKLSVLFAVILCSMVFSVVAKAEVPASYYVGKWSVNVAVPGGDKNMIMNVELKEDKLTGGIVDPATNTIKAPFTKVETTEDNITVYFMMSAHNVYMTMEKKDENSFTGSMLDMFDCTGARVVEPKTEAK
jgi:hypothetical protein